MECPNCQKSYDSFASGDLNVIPRILSVCGHSVCHLCITTLYQDKQVECPLCFSINPAESIQNYTKNLALLQILVENSGSDNMSPHKYSNVMHEGLSSSESSLQTSGHSGKINSLKLEMSSSSTLHSYKSSNQGISPQCQVHSKTIEAFCWTDRLPLCIDCLLIQPLHKNHEILNIEKSLEKEEINLKTVQERVALIKQKIQKSQDNLNKQKFELDTQETIQISSLTKFFNDIKESIEQRQKEIFLQISSSIETRRRWVIDSECKIKDYQNEMNSTDFQLLSAQLGPKNNHLDQLLYQIDKEQQAVEILDKCETFGADILLNQQYKITQFDAKKEIQLLQKLVNDIQSLYTEPIIPILAAQRKSINNFTTSVNRQSHRDLSHINSTIAKKTLAAKECSTTRKMTASQQLLNDKQLSNTNGANSTNSTTSVSNFSSRLSTLPIKNNAINSKAKERQSLTARQSLLNSQKNDKQLDKQRQSQQTPLKQINESKTKVQRQSNFQRNPSRVINAVDTSQVTTAKVSLYSKVVNNQKDQSFESCLRQTLLTPQNNSLHNQSQLIKSNSNNFMARINEKQHDDEHTMNTPQTFQNSRKGSTANQYNVPQSNNTSRLYLRDLMNRSVEESDNEDNSSYTSISKLVPDQSQIFQQTAIHIMDLPDQSFNTTMNSGAQLAFTGLQFEQEQDSKQPFLQTTALEDFKLNQSTNFGKAISSVRSQAARQSVGYPSLREKRNNIKQEKIMSVAHQQESEQWISKQAINVEIIAQARQMSSRRADSIQPRTSDSKQNQSQVNTMFLPQNKVNQGQKRHMSLLQKKHEEQNSNMLDSRKDSYDQMSESKIMNFYQSNHSAKNIRQSQTSLGLGNQSVAVNRQILKVKEEPKTVIGIIGSSNTPGQKFIQLDLFDPLSDMQMTSVQIANFKHQIGERPQIVSDPRQERNYFILGGKIEVGFTQKIYQFDSRLQIIEQSDISDLPDSFVQGQYFAVQCGFYQNKTSHIPLLCVAYVKKLIHSGDSQDLINLSQLEILSYDFSSNIWDQLPALPLQLSEISPQSDFQFLIHQNSIYIIGGQQDEQIHIHGLRFDFDKQEWSTISDMSEGRIYFSATSCNEEGIMVNGGFNGQKVLDTCELYDPEQNKWRQLPNLNTPRMYHNSIDIIKSVGGQIYVVGGIDNNERILNSIEFFNFLELKWTQKEISNENPSNLTAGWYNLNLVKISL